MYYLSALAQHGAAWLGMFSLSVSKLCLRQNETKLHMSCYGICPKGGGVLTRITSHSPLPLDPRLIKEPHARAVTLGRAAL